MSLLISTCELAIGARSFTMTVSGPFEAFTDTVFWLSIVTVQVRPVPPHAWPQPVNALCSGSALSATVDPGGKVKAHPLVEPREQLMPDGFDVTNTSPSPLSAILSVGVANRAVTVVELESVTVQLGALPHPPPL